jgi:hypothetical protein
VHNAYPTAQQDNPTDARPCQFVITDTVTNTVVSSYSLSYWHSQLPGIGDTNIVFVRIVIPYYEHEPSREAIQWFLVPPTVIQNAKGGGDTSVDVTASLILVPSNGPKLTPIHWEQRSYLGRWARSSQLSGDYELWPPAPGAAAATVDTAGPNEPPFKPFKQATPTAEKIEMPANGCISDPHLHSVWGWQPHNHSHHIIFSQRAQLDLNVGFADSQYTAHETLTPRFSVLNAHSMPFFNVDDGLIPLTVSIDIPTINHSAAYRFMDDPSSRLVFFAIQKTPDSRLVMNPHPIYVLNHNQPNSHTFRRSHTDRNKIHAQFNVENYMFFRHTTPHFLMSRRIIIMCAMYTAAGYIVPIACCTLLFTDFFLAFQLPNILSDTPSQVVLVHQNNPSIRLLQSYTVTYRHLNATHGTLDLRRHIPARDTPTVHVSRAEEAMILRHPIQNSRYTNNEAQAELSGYNIRAVTTQQINGADHLVYRSEEQDPHLVVGTLP